MATSTTSNGNESTVKQIRLTMADFRRLALGRMVDLIKDMAAREDQRATNFVKRTPTPLERYWTTEELIEEAHSRWEMVAEQYPQLAQELSAAAPILEQLESAGSAYRLLDAYRIIVTHEKRHFLQSLRVLKMKDFPRALPEHQ